jgi:hypothetical protein
MTARALIDRRFRMVMLLIYMGLALFIGAMVAHEALGMPVWVWVPGIIGFGVAWLTIMGAWVVGFRCPSCRGRLTPLLMQRGGLRMDRRIRFCPYCARPFDAEVTGPGSPPNSPLQLTALHAAVERLY